MANQGLGLAQSPSRLRRLKGDFGSRCPEGLAATADEAETVATGEAVLGARPAGPALSIVQVVPVGAAGVAMAAPRAEVVTVGRAALPRPLHSESRIPFPARSKLLQRVVQAAEVGWLGRPGKEGPGALKEKQEVFVVPPAVTGQTGPPGRLHPEANMASLLLTVESWLTCPP